MGKIAEEHVEKLIPRTNAARKAAEENLVISQEEMRIICDARGTKEHRFKPGDIILIRQNKVPVSTFLKIFDKNSGQFYATGVTKLGNILLRELKTNKAVDHPVNPTRLRHFYTDRDVLENDDKSERS